MSEGDSRSNKPMVFISYSRDYSYPAAHIEMLLKSNYAPYWDRKIEEGTDWELELSRRIAKCDFFLFLATRKSISSLYCKREYNFAVDKNKRCVVVKLQRQIEMPQPLTKPQHVDLSDFTQITIDDVYSKLERAFLLATPLTEDHEFDLPSDRSFSIAVDNVEQIIGTIKRGEANGRQNSREVIELELLCKVIGDNALWDHIRYLRQIIDGVEVGTREAAISNIDYRIEQLRHYYASFPLRVTG